MLGNVGCNPVLIVWSIAHYIDFKLVETADEKTILFTAHFIVYFIAMIIIIIISVVRMNLQTVVAFNSTRSNDWSRYITYCNTIVLLYCSPVAVCFVRTEAAVINDNV